MQLNEFFSVAENLFFLDSKAARHGLMSRRDIAREAQPFLEANDFDMDPGALVKDLAFPDKVLVSLLAALRLLEGRKAEGMAILLITHRIDDVGHIDKMNLLRLTYTQVYSLENSADSKREFDQYFKYNEAVLLKLPVNLFVVDAEERVKIVNELCKKYFRLEEDGPANRSLAELLGEGNGELLALLREALRSEEASAAYHVPLTIGGEDTVNNVRTLPIYDEGVRIGSVIIIEDISEFDQLQKQVILSDKLASVGLLAAGVAHEINNPLEIAYNYLKYIKLSHSDARLHETVDELHEKIACIAGIVRDLLSLSGGAIAEREEIDVNELIVSIIGLLRHSAADKRISIAFESEVRELALTVNRNEIKQVILNLVKNSFEAMPGGGEIRIATSRGEDEDGRSLGRIEFMDSGPGISGANLNDVFIPFYSTRKGKGENVGLGLSICYGIVKRHDGSLSVRNLEPSGCCFTTALPG